MIEADNEAHAQSSSHSREPYSLRPPISASPRPPVPPSPRPRVSPSPIPPVSVSPRPGFFRQWRNAILGTLLVTAGLATALFTVLARRLGESSLASARPIDSLISVFL